MHHRTMTCSRPVGLTGALFLMGALWTMPADSPVADAAQQGDLATVRNLLRQGADVNAAQGDGMTALHWAAMHDAPAMVEVVVYAGGHLEATTRLGGYTPLHLAAREGNDRAVEALLAAGADPHAMSATGATALHFAAGAGRPAAIRALLSSGADVDARDGYADRTPLMFATAANRLGAMDVLLEAGADVFITSRVVDYPELAAADRVERQQRARLMAAGRPPEAESSSGRSAGGNPTPAPRTEPARTAGAATPDPDSPTPETAGERPENATPAPRPLSYTDLVGRQGGLTALHYAARDGRAEATDRLLAAGADINQLTGGDETSPLLIAVINGNYDLAKWLLERGADPNRMSEDGVGPLFAALNSYWALRTWYPQPTAWQQQETTHLDLMRALLDAGADPNGRVHTHIWYTAYNAGRMGVDFSGATPFWRAAYSLDVDAMRLLVEYGADPDIPTAKPPSRSFGRRDGDSTDTDPSGLPPVPAGGPAVHPLHAASGVGYGTSRVGQQHRTVPDGWLPAVRYLVEELGVDVNVRDHDGYSAVHNAAARGDNETILFLVEHGADVTFVSRRGQTTVDMANGPQQRVQPFPETIALLESLGAVNNHNCQSCE